MTELLISHAVAFVGGLGFGYWVVTRRRERHAANVYGPPAGIVSSTPYALQKKDQNL